MALVLAARNVRQSSNDDDLGFQTRFGSQSYRGLGTMPSLMSISASTHAMQCVARMLTNEAEMAGEWAVFYHCYSHSAALLQIQAAVASVLFGFPAALSPIPRLRADSFHGRRTASELLAAGLPNDHHADFRAVAISCNTSLMATSSEASPLDYFLSGYSVLPATTYPTLIDGLLAACGVERPRRPALSEELVAACAAAGLPTPWLSPRAARRAPGASPVGAILQIFVRREVVDELAYASEPMGVVDPSRMPLGATLARPAPPAGQARLVCRPDRFLDPAAVRAFAFDACPARHAGRAALAARLAAIVRAHIAPTEAARAAAAETLVPGFRAAVGGAEAERADRRRVEVDGVRANNALVLPSGAPRARPAWSVPTGG